MSPETRQRIVDLWMDGYSYSAIGRQIGHAHAHVKRVCEQLARSAAAVPLPPPEQTDDYLRAASVARTPKKDMCAALGFSFNRLQRELARLGLPVCRNTKTNTKTKEEDKTS